MREIDSQSIVAYLRDRGRIPESRAATAEPLGWGVSNIVIRVAVEGAAPFVIKQSREQLRTKALWVSRLDRIWQEREALELLARVLDPGDVPRVLFSEPDDYLFAMSHAAPESTVWKEDLLAGRADPEVARRAGALLGRMHSRLRDHPGLSGRLAETTVFDELRVGPFYRAVAKALPETASAIDALIVAMRNPPDLTFVHADFTPKNILVHREGLTVVDFETAHAGDPAFDIGLFLAHLSLKAFRTSPRDQAIFGLVEPFWQGYHTEVGPGDADLSERSTRHAAACMLARIDGTSPVDYLDESVRGEVREIARNILLRPSMRISEV